MKICTLKSVVLLFVMGALTLFSTNQLSAQCTSAAVDLPDNGFPVDGDVANAYCVELTYDPAILGCATGINMDLAHDYQGDLSIVVNACGNTLNVVQRPGATGNCAAGSPFGSSANIGTPPNVALVNVDFDDANATDPEGGIAGTGGAYGITADDACGLGTAGIASFADLCAACPPGDILMQICITDHAAGDAGAAANIGVNTPTAAVCGCTDPAATNYDAAANIDDGSCMLPVACSVTADFLAPTSACSGSAINWAAGPTCLGIDGPATQDGGVVVDLFVYAPAGVAGEAPAGYETTIDVSSPTHTAQGGFPESIDVKDPNLLVQGFDFLCGAPPTAAGFINNTCDAFTVTYFLAVFDWSLDTDGDLNSEYEPNCEVLRYDVVINPAPFVLAEIPGGCGAAATVTVSAADGTLCSTITGNVPPTPACTPIAGTTTNSAPLAGTYDQEAELGLAGGCYAPQTYNAAADCASEECPCELTAISSALVDEGCPGDLIGSITVTATYGGMDALEYSIGGGFQSSNAFTGLAAGTYTVTVQELNNNACTLSETVTIGGGVDTTPPVCSTQDITVLLDAAGNATVVVGDLDTGTADDCGALASLVLDNGSFSCANVGANTATITATDAAGNISQCFATVNIVDNTPPTALCQDLTVTLNGLGQATITPADIDNGSADACGIASMTVAPNVFDCTNLGANTVTLTVTDNNGNVSTCTSAIVTVEDTTPPGAACANLTVQLDENGDASVTVDDIDNGSSDECGISNIEANPVVYDCSNLGDNDVTLTVTDNDGNVSTCIAVVTVEDNIAPVLSCPGDIVVDLNPGECDATINFNVSATDNCEGAIIPTQTIGTLGSGDVYVPGVYPQAYEAVDASGNISTCAFTVTVNAFTPPSDALACNDLVHVTLDANCEGLITPDMLLEGQYKCFDLYEVNVFEGDASGTPIPGSPAISSDYVDATLTVTITDTETGLMCWGEVLLENKGTPDIECGASLPLACAAGDTAPTYPDDYPDAEDSCCELTEENFSYVDSALPGGYALEGLDGVFGPDQWLQLPSGGGSIVFANDGSQVTITGDNTAAGLTSTEIQYSFPIDGTVAFDWSTFNFDYPGYDFFVGLIDDAGVVTTVLLESASTNGSESFAVEANQVLVLGVVSVDGEFGALEATISNFSFTTAGGTPENDGCEGAFLRTWTVTGCNGINTNSCTQVVIRVRPTILDVEFPDDVVLECGDLYAPANLDGNITVGPFDEDYPNVDGADISDVYCNLGATYEDQIVPICEGSFKVLRTWTVVDWCTGDIAIEDQIIKVLDTGLPTITCPDNITLSTDVNECTAQLILPAPSVTDLCSATTYTATADAGTLTQANNGSYYLEDLPIGTHTVTYTAEDDCGNEASCTFTITVRDELPPIAVCDEHTDVALGGNGEIRVFAETFDDGSHDNCGDVSFLVKRMDNGAPCAPPSQSQFRPYVDFCCSDVGNTLMVILQVTDESGNTNECMVEVFVEDKLGPHIVCPPDITISCKYEYDLEDLGSYFGNVVTDQDDREDVITNDSEGPFGNENWGPEGYAADNCDVTVTEEYTYNEECGNGEIVRTFTATDPQGLTATCSQTITISNFRPFAANNINWPSAVVERDCSQGLDPSSTGEPGINDDRCDNVFVGHEDLQLDVSPPHCYKILRTWVVIDWCQYDPDFPNGGGRWEFEQVLKVTDNDAPEFTSCQSPDTGCSYDEDCGPGYIELTAEAEDNCTDVTYNYTIDAFNDGSVDITGNGNDASGDYPIGLHSITFYATDDCGNVAECSYTFEIIDCKQPTPICKVLASSIMPSAGMLTIWATDFEAGSSFDNCTDYEDLDFRIRKTTIELPQSTDVPTETSVTFDCTEIGTQWVELWVGDETGNWDYCTTYIVIQDPTGACGNPDPTALISGRITNESDEEVSAVAIDLAGSNGFEPFVTGIDGAYAFNNVSMHENYTVTPEKDVDYLNGVTTFDIVVMSKHILGLETLPTPYKMIAADVNKSGSITAADIVALRKLILHIDTEFQNNTSWRFVDKSFAFADATNPFASTFPEVISINDLDENTSDADFMAIKIGDVNDSAIANNLIGTDARNTVGELLFNVNDTQLKAGETYTIDFNADKDVLGYQFTLNFNQDALQFVDIAKGDTQNFGLSLLDEGVVTTSWNNKTANASFSLTFKATTDAQLSKVLSVNSRFTAAEAYTENADLLDVNLAFNTDNGTVVSAQFELYQNNPNPVKEQTVVGFNLPEASTATLTIFDVSGKVLKQYTGDFAKGYNQFTLNKSEIAGAGVLYYQLATDTDSDTKKMILID